LGMSSNDREPFNAPTPGVFDRRELAPTSPGQRRPVPRRQINLTVLVRSIEIPRGATRALRSERADEPRASALQVEPSGWTRAGRWSVMGTAFDLAIGALLSHDALQPVRERAVLACAPRDRRFGPVAAPLRRLLRLGPTRVRADGTRRRHRDYYRALLLLAEMDAVARSAAAPAPDAVFREGPVDSLRSLRNRLRQVFPVEAVSELRALVACAVRDLPKMGTGYHHYNPIFGTPLGNTLVGADGDLQIDDLLIEFKVSKNEAVTPEHIRQLLGYVALDRLGGQHQIHRIGIYNPRRDERWVRGVEDAARLLGWESFDDFQRRFVAAAAGA
jgi:hypothetical protein